MTSTPKKPLVIVTGSSGLIGSNVCRELSTKYMIAGLDIVEPCEDFPSLHWFNCDFTSAESVGDALAAVRKSLAADVASVVHLAAYYDFAGEPSPLYKELTVDGTRRLLHELRKFHTVQQFVFSSSLLVMQPCKPGEKLTEDSATDAEWDYPESKLAAEEVIRCEQGTTPKVILRLAGVYDEQGHSPPITQNIRRIAEKELESYLFPGDAERGQAFVHLDDVVTCFRLVVEKRHQLGDYETFLIAENECLSYERLQDIIGELIHGVEDWPTIRIPKFVAKAGAWAKNQLADSEEERPFIKPWMVDLADAHYPVDNMRAQVLLDWHAEHQLSATLPKMIENLKNAPRHWYEVNNLPLPADQQMFEQIAQ